MFDILLSKLQSYNYHRFLNKILEVRFSNMGAMARSLSYNAIRHQLLAACNKSITHAQYMELLNELDNTN